MVFRVLMIKFIETFETIYDSLTLHVAGQFALFAGDFLQLQVDLLPIEIVSAALSKEKEI